MNTKTIHLRRIALAVALLASLALVLPVLAMVLLGLLTLIVPLLLVFIPLLVPVSLVLLVDRLRRSRDTAGVTDIESASIGAPALHASAP
jgi:hypothetical protein